jgi:hypothetical protein
VIVATADHEDPAARGDDAGPSDPLGDRRQLLPLAPLRIEALECIE